MGKVRDELSNLDLKELDRFKVAKTIADILEKAGYELEEVDSYRPWGQFWKVKNEHADKFIKEFFEKVELPKSDLPRTPKILLHYPMARNSWQYHDRRKEYWQFLTDGFYYLSSSDEHPASPIETRGGELVTLEPRQRHRMGGHYGTPTLVAEIWEHTEDRPSNEEDIVRLEDDYKLVGRKVQGGG